MIDINKGCVGRMGNIPNIPKPQLPKNLKVSKSSKGLPKRTKDMLSPFDWALIVLLIAIIIMFIIKNITT